MKPDQAIPASTPIVPIHLLLVEDNPGDARLVYEMLRNQLHIKLEVADCLAACLARLDQGGIDLVLLDLGLGDSQGLDTLTSVAHTHPAMPVVALTGLDDDALALRTVQAGGQDYLTKNTVTPEILRRTICHAFERKRAEGRLASHYALLQAIINSPKDSIVFSLDAQYRYTAFNDKHRQEMKKVWNVDIEIGMNMLDCMNIQEFRALAKGSMDRSLSGESFLEEQYQSNLDIYYEFTWDPVMQGKDIIGVAVFIRDITERKLAEKKIKDSLAEKEILLKEVHHRVKNNLMTIIGLIKMQETKADNEMFTTLLLELEGRIRSMALVHECLHKSDDLVHIDLQNYIETMSSHICAQFVSGQDIRFSVRAARVEVDLDIAVSCGLILNELIANAYKHAFPGGRPGSGTGQCEIKVSVEQTGGMLALTVADNGIGKPMGMNWENPETLGLQLVKMLSLQIGGSIEMECSSGTVFHLKFPNPVRNGN